MVRIMDFLNGNFALNENKPRSIEGKLNKKGNIDVKSAMRSLILPQDKVNWANLVWSSSNITRHSVVFWLAFHNKFLTKDKILKGRIIDSNVCVFCKSASEKIEHLFFECTFTKAISGKVLLAVNVRRKPLHWRREVSWFTRKANGKSLLARLRRTTMVARIYTIWRARNCLIFHNKNITEEEVFNQIKEIMIFKYLGFMTTKKEADCGVLQKWFTC